jgi:hypothetical protein
MKTKATRDKILVEADGPRIVESFMNPCTWMDTFACMVSRAKVLAILKVGFAMVNRVSLPRTTLLTFFYF